MTGKKRATALLGVSLLVIAMLFGCSFLLEQGAGQSGWYIKLNISDPAASKAINVTEHDVTGLNIDVFDPEHQPLETFVWAAEDGSKSYLIPVTQEGEHEIVVTHISEENGEVVEATEWAYFNIQAMVITVIDIVPGFIGVINVSGGGEEPAKDDGTLTVSVADLAAPEETSVLVGVFEAGVDPMPDPMATIQAMGHIILLGGAGSDTVSMPTGEDFWIGTGGDFYDVYIWVDMNENLDVVMFPEPGIDLQLDTYPVTVEIDGDIVLDFFGSDFVVVSGGP